MANQTIDFTIIDGLISLQNRNYYKLFYYELSIPLIALTTVILLIFIFRFTIFKKPQLFRIFNNQLTNTSFLPFNYLIILHLEKGASTRPCKLNGKLKIELLNSKQKRSFNFSIPVKYLIAKSSLSFTLFKLNQHLFELLKFFCSFYLTCPQNDICFLVHRKKVLEHIQSVHVDLDMDTKLDLNVYLHGLTIYSFNSNFAYYLSLEEFIDYSTSKSSSGKQQGSKNTITSFNLMTKQHIVSKKPKFICKFSDLFEPNYVNKTHPVYGYSVEHLYLEFYNRLSSSLPKYLSENLAPVNTQTSIQLELLYYINLSNQLLINYYASNKSVEPELKGLVASSPFNLKETLIFHLFNINLLFFILMVCLNLSILDSKSNFSDLTPVIFYSSLFSLLFTELIVNLYTRCIKRTNRFTNTSVLNKIKFRQFLINFIFFFCLIVCLAGLSACSTILLTFSKQHQTLHPFFAYRSGFTSHFLSNKFYQRTESVSFIKEINFILIIFYFSLFVMFRFWTLIISIIRLMFACLVTLYHERSLLESKSKDNKIVNQFYVCKPDQSLASLDQVKSTKSSKASLDPVKSTKSKVASKKKSPKRSKIRKEEEDNLLKFFTKK